MPIDLSKYSGLTAANKELNVDYRPLNFDKLLASKALRVTHQGDSEGNYNKDPAVGFSLVSGYNDALGGNEGTKLWPDNPKFYDIVKEMVTERPHDIAPYKYMQIIKSARDMGLKDEDIFLPSTTMPDAYRKGGRVKLI